jgi:hypothetical protein
MTPDDDLTARRVRRMADLVLKDLGLAVATLDTFTHAVAPAQLEHLEPRALAELDAAVVAMDAALGRFRNKVAIGR